MISNKLNTAKRNIDAALELLAKTPEKNAILTLIEACRAVDERYQEFCEEQDDAYGQPIGTTYQEGINLEFYIESDAWHTISCALRELDS